MHRGRDRAKRAGLCQLHVFFFTCFYLILSTYHKSPKIFADQVPRIGQSGALSAYVEPGPLSAYVEDGTLSAYVEGALGSYAEVAHSANA